MSTPTTTRVIKTLKAKNYNVKNAGHRYGNRCLLVQKPFGAGFTIDGDKRQLGRQIRQIACELSQS